MVGLLVRVVVAALILGGLVWFGYSFMRSYVAGAAEEREARRAGPPPTEDVRDEDVRFRCEECGLEVLVVRVAATADDLKPLRHCREEMSVMPDDAKLST